MSDRAMDLQPLVLGRVPLSGRVLIEASAGTGKTWTIAALYVRLLLEARLPVERILVLTFTNAATAELRTRIRKRLVELRDALRGEAPIEAGDDALLAHVLRISTDRVRDVSWLDAAIESFDLAPIHTIHGFCQRALAEHAFDSGAAFDAELVGDDAQLAEAAVRDCWRQDMCDAHPLWAAWLQERGIDPAALMARTAALRARPEAHRYLPAAPSATLETDYVAAYARARALWQSHADEAFAVLDGWAPLDRKTYSRRRLPEWWAQIDACLRHPDPRLELAECLRRFTPAVLTERCAGNEAPAHALFDALGALFDAWQALTNGFVARFAHWSVDVARRVAVQLGAHKRARRLQSYDDLLRDLADALAAEGGAALARLLRERYAAALIDEFQDTDPLQYGIFEAIYAGSDRPRYFVGDPKQAIYAFRGADVQAYLRARCEAQAAFTLSVNRRSVPPLVDAVNALFRHGDPFLAREIEFRPVDACPPQAALMIDGEAQEKLQCWFLAREADNKPIAKGVAGERAVEAVAGDVARLLRLAQTGGATLQGKQTRPLIGRDIAVLVDTHEQARRVKAALAARGIASVTYGQDSVYHSEEAAGMARVLAAVAEPTREALLRAALATEMLGRDAAALDALAEDGVEWEALLDRFVGYQRLAREHGFIRMWRSLLMDEGVAARVLALPNGERRMTNLQHLADLLHQTVGETGADLESLARLLAQARTRPIGEAEAQQLRLESDEHLVQVLTLHAAKGLEFAVVYCPFLWDGRLRSTQEDWLRFHDERGRLAFDLGSDRIEAHRLRAQHDELGENLRLVYVALTRAKHRCVVVWGAINEAETSALAWLLHGDGAASGDRIAALRERFRALSDGGLRAALLERGERCDGAIALCDLPEEAGLSVQAESPAAAPGFAARRFEGRIPAPWRVSSFSGLIAAQEREAPDYDALPHAVAPRSAEPAPPDTLFALPRGARIGTLIHQLFESIDFAWPQGAPVRAKLAEFDVDARWAPVLGRMLADVVATPLDDAGALRLDRVDTARRLVELEFVFPVGEAQLHALRDALAPLRAAGSRLPESIGRLVLPPARGFIRGFVDLVFEFEGRYYIADYKSNWLGNRYEDYAPARLAAAMSESFYDLQYLLYTVALHRHLRLRLPGYDYERHFGGVYYLFVRGMQPALGCRSGVYAARPPGEMIEGLDRLFTRTERCLA